MPGTAFTTSSSFFFVILILCTSSSHGRGAFLVQNSSNITHNQGAVTLQSEGGRFQLGFFNHSNNTYLGIWYNNYTHHPVWVANRNNPMPTLQRPNSSSYFITIGVDGHAKVKHLGSSSHSYWSTDYTTKPSSASNITLQLLDTGNLILVDKGRKGRRKTIWQSFDHPTDTFLPGMDIRRIGVNLTSWKGLEDPGYGQYLLEQGRPNKLFMYRSSRSSNSILHWESTFSSLHPYLVPLLRNNVTGNLSSTIRLVMSSNGSVQLWELHKGERWSVIWMAPNRRCDVFSWKKLCGNFGVCNAGNSVKCKCLPGYKPNDQLKWDSKDFSDGCSKKTNDQSGQLFLSLPMINLATHPNNKSDSRNEMECRGLCLGNCRAYSFATSQSRCLIWNNELTHIVEEEYHNPSAHTLYIRVNNLDIESGSRTCSICGTNVIPYPLSTNGSCGDPNYFKFHCNTANGQVYFRPVGGESYKYKVSLINQSSSTFFVQLPKGNPLGTCNTTTSIGSNVFNFSYSSQFSVVNCSIASLMGKHVIVVELSWNLPPPPACNSSVDCKDWPNTTCGEHTQGKKACLCEKGFHSPSLFINCTEEAPVHHKHMPWSLKAGIATASGLALLLFGTCLLLLHLQRKRAIQTEGSIKQIKTNDMEDIDIPFFDYQSIIAATDNFSDANKLGAGGFGPVYKGKLTDGNEVAVKRLSTTSAQGIEEFRNEVILIAKLQHRNLVRVLGYCMKENEKILIYEYMPNKSLNSFIFDQNVSPSLDWMKRFNIILGIVRGLLYLHQDSRFRMIHRDLKPSNILLDEELNPKISDFGLARIVAGNEMGSTSRVIGTYGYMSPEYALDGCFSIKSDVYSFGMVVLEVISGRKCTSLFQFEDGLINLLGYAWTLWDEERPMELVDGSIMDSCDSSEVKRCINVALLCVQEDPSDRPTMSTVLLMLGGGDNMSLPHPKQPVFATRESSSVTASSSIKFGTSDSNVELTT